VLSVPGIDYESLDHAEQESCRYRLLIEALLTGCRPHSQNARCEPVAA
jgi:hypothetical protein